MTKIKAFSSLTALFVLSVFNVGCHSGRMRTTYPPEAANFSKIEEGAKKVGWKVERVGGSAEDLMIYPPGDEMHVDTAPDINTGSVQYPSSVGVKCKSGDWDVCKKYFDQITVAAGLGPAGYQ
jgi:hypothetical protein